MYKLFNCPPFGKNVTWLQTSNISTNLKSKHFLEEDIFPNHLLLYMGTHIRCNRLYLGQCNSYYKMVWKHWDDHLSELNVHCMCKPNMWRQWSFKSFARLPAFYFDKFSDLDWQSREFGQFQHLLFDLFVQKKILCTPGIFTHKNGHFAIHYDLRLPFKI